jgi:hypothetical protein
MLGVMLTGDRQEIRNQLALYKEKGIVQYERTLEIPSHERITALVSLPDGRRTVSAALAASINSALTSMNTRLSMNEEQILDLADEIIDQAAEDNLGLEDVLLFLQMMITGKTGKNYDRMDIPTFFEHFEVYRQERHEALLRKREEENVNFKCAGDNRRTSEELNEPEQHISNIMADYKVQEMIKKQTEGK